MFISTGNINRISTKYLLISCFLSSFKQLLCFNEHWKFEWIVHSPIYKIQSQKKPKCISPFVFTFKIIAIIILYINIYIINNNNNRKTDKKNEKQNSNYIIYKKHVFSKNCITCKIFYHLGIQNSSKIQSEYGQFGACNHAIMQFVMYDFKQKCQEK